MALVPMFLIAQSRAVRAFYRRNRQPLLNAGVGVLAFSFALTTVKKNRELSAAEERMTRLERELKTLQDTVTSDTWAASTAAAMGAPKGSHVTLLRALQDHVTRVVPREEEDEETSTSAALELIRTRLSVALHGNEVIKPAKKEAPDSLDEQDGQAAAAAAANTDTDTATAAAAAAGAAAEDDLTAMPKWVDKRDAAWLQDSENTATEDDMAFADFFVQRQLQKAGTLESTSAQEQRRMRDHMIIYWRLQRERRKRAEEELAKVEWNEKQGWM